MPLRMKRDHNRAGTLNRLRQISNACSTQDLHYTNYPLTNVYLIADTLQRNSVDIALYLVLFHLHLHWIKAEFPI